MWDTGTRQYYYPSPFLNYLTLNSFYKKVAYRKILFTLGDYAKCIMHIDIGGHHLSSLLSKKHDTWKKEYVFTGVLYTHTYPLPFSKGKVNFKIPPPS